MDEVKHLRMAPDIDRGGEIGHVGISERTIGQCETTHNHGFHGNFDAFNGINQQKTQATVKTIIPPYFFHGSAWRIVIGSILATEWKKVGGETIITDSCKNALND